MTLTVQPHAEPFAPRIGRSVSIDQAAQLLGVSRRTIYNRIRDGRLRTIRTLGGSQRVLLESLHECLGRSTTSYVGGSIPERPDFATRRALV